MMMKILFVGLALLGLVLAGCKSSKPGKGPPPSYASPEAQTQAMAAQGTIFVRGEVRHPVVPWTEDMRLSDALLAADYMGRNDPFSILIVRRGKLIQVSTRRLLSGTQDPFIEPGDVIEVKR